jgi:isocitrate dehydrogenase kinase/phosphatase
LKQQFILTPFSGELWFEVKRRYVQLVSNHYQPELAETFYNSAYCALFHRDYFDNAYIFVRVAVLTEYINLEKPAYHVYYPKNRGFRNSIHQALLDSGINLPFEDLERDVRNISRTLIQHNFPRPRKAHLNFQLQVISSVFYRN